MNILITGSNGFIAGMLIPSLITAGHSLTKLVRSSELKPGEFPWNPVEGSLDLKAFNGIDAVIHLAGESIAEGRWTKEKKKRILESRVISTKFLADTLASLSHPPEVLIVASAIGYYGDRGEEHLDEHSTKGEGFLPDVCASWESAAAPARAKGIRVVHLRFGLILSPAGGALQKILLPFKFGAGGTIGSGKQYWSWIAIDDVIGAIHHALLKQDVQGPVNFVAPHAVTNREFTKVLGKVLSRPTILPAPAFALKIILGKMADELLLSSLNVEPKKLLSTGYHYRFDDLETALLHLLGK